MIFIHPITKQPLKDVNEFANVFHDEIIDPFEVKTGLKINGWNDDGIVVEELRFKLPIWFVLKILNDWK